jgi:hypothetical protein
MTRPDLGFNADLDENESQKPNQIPDIAFPKKSKQDDRTSIRQKAAQNAAETGFVSREPSESKSVTIRTQRDRRKKSTNRNIPFTTRIAPEFHKTFYDIVDDNDLSVCEAFELAIKALAAKFNKT